MKIITIYVQDLIFRLQFFVIKGHSQISSVHFKDETAMKFHSLKSRMFYLDKI